MKKILVPTDFSKASENALSIATEFARKTHAVVELLHVIESPYESELSVTGEYFPMDGADNMFIMKSIEVAKKKISEILHSAKYAGVRFQPKIKLGDAFHHFTKNIAKEPADLIIMGTEGSERFMKGIFSSSNTEKVINQANCLVLTIKNEIDNFRVRNFVLATNFQNDSPEFIKQIKDMQCLFDFRIHLVYIHPDQKLKEKEESINLLAKSFVKKFGIDNYDFFIQGEWTEYGELLQYARKVKADMIAISKHHHRGMEWIGELSEDLVNHSELPVLTFKSA